MKVNIIFRDARYLLTIRNGDTVANVKEHFVKRFGLNMKGSTDNADVFELIALYAGAPLHDSWNVIDFVVPGSTLRLCQRKKPRVYLRILSPFPMEGLLLTTQFDVSSTVVGDLKTMIQERTGVPVSVFRLTTVNGTQMYDTYPLGKYGVFQGSDVRLHVWDGCSPLLQAAMIGDVTCTMNNVVLFNADPALHRYQLRVALFIAARNGHNQLVLQLLKAGARCEDVIGEHPCREWVNEPRHPETYNTAVHVAAKMGRTAVLQTLIYHNIGSLIVRDGNGRTPANVARRFKQTDCFKFLVMQQLRDQKIGGLTLGQYARVRKWLAKARDRLSYYKYDTDKMLLLGRFSVTKTGPVVGSMIQVDGFGNNIQSSASCLDKTKMTRRKQWLWSKEDNSNGIEYHPGSELEGVRKLCCEADKQTESPASEELLREKSSSFTQSKECNSSNEQGVFITQLAQATGANKGESSNRVTTTRKESEATSVAKPIGNNLSNAVVLSRMFNRTIAEIMPKQSSSSTVKDSNSNDSDSVKSTASCPELLDQTLPHRSSSEEKQMVAELESRLMKANSEPKLSANIDGTRFSRHFCSKMITADMVQRVTGLSTYDFAKQSLEVGSVFKSMSWLKQLRIAMSYNKNTIRRGLSR